MTCKDNCLHYEVCLTAFSSKGMYLGDDAEEMECFKNKADFVEVKHGYDTGEDNIFHCSVCGYGVDDIYESDETNYPVWQFNFCPHCGAKMDIKTT